MKMVTKYTESCIRNLNAKLSYFKGIVVKNTIDPNSYYSKNDPIKQTEAYCCNSIK